MTSFRVDEGLLGRLDRDIETGPGCWLWSGAKRSAGYGTVSVRVDGRPRGMGSHRVVYELLVGPIPAGLELDHLCYTPSCVNPDHLEPVTPLENKQRARLRRRGIAGDLPQQSQTPMTTLLAEWSDRVSALMVAKNMTLSDLARLVGVEPSTIGRFLCANRAGRRSAPRDELKWKIAGALNERMDVLWAWPRIVPPSPARAAS